MEFTKENWENAPEGTRLEWSVNVALWEEVDLIGFTKDGVPVIEAHGQLRSTTRERLRIILPKRTVPVQLWRTAAGGFWAGVFDVDRPMPKDWTFIGKHTFEIEGE